MLKHNQLLTGKVDLSGHEIDVADITAPVLIFAGNTDGIAPINSVKALVKLLTKSHEVRFEIVPGGHLGMLTGRAARGTTWVTMDEWIEQYSTPDDRPPAAHDQKAGGRRPVAPGTGAGKTKPAPAAPRAPADARWRPTARPSGPTPSGGSPRPPRATWPASLEPAPTSDPRAGAVGRRRRRLRPRWCSSCSSAASAPATRPADVPPLRRDG